MTPPVGTIELPPGGQQRFPSQRPYKYGMVMLCIGALINWLGLAENYFEPVRYVGVACIVTGAMLIIAAMCCWMNSTTPTPPPPYDTTSIHVIDIPESSSTVSSSKPPDYESIAAPPSYDVAIKLNPAHLYTNSNNSESTPGYTVSMPDRPPPEYSTQIAPVHRAGLAHNRDELFPSVKKDPKALFVRLWYFN